MSCWKACRASPRPGRSRACRKNLESEFSRIQFTPDLLPSDVTGGEILRADGQFEFRKGPVFGNLILADEINRAPPKVQSALLEAMEERHVTVAGKRYDLPPLFMVLATQNPIEQEGTYPLPEAQMDRFLMHVRIDYPSDADEVKVMRLVRSESAASAASAQTLTKIPQAAIMQARAEIDRVTTKEVVETYMGRADRRDAAAGRVRRASQELDRGRCEPARLARTRQMLADLCLAPGAQLRHARGCAGGGA
jgi:MoxR-like ATPase